MSVSVRRCISAFVDAAVDRLEIEDEMRVLLRTPYRVLEVELPLVRDDGRLAVHRGDRERHDHARRPFEGGLRYRPSERVVRAIELRGF